MSQESERERDLRNQCEGFDVALQVFMDEWRKREPACAGRKGTDPTADLLWKLAERAKEKFAATDREWRQLMGVRLDAERLARPPSTEKKVGSKTNRAVRA